VTIHAVLNAISTTPDNLRPPPALVSINCMSLQRKKDVYDAIWMGLELHKEKEDPSDIAYPLSSQLASTKIADQRKKLKEFVQAEIDTLPDEKTKTGKKRGRRQEEAGCRGFLIVFLDEVDTLVTKARTSPVPHIILSLELERGYIGRHI